MATRTKTGKTNSEQSVAAAELCTAAGNKYADTIKLWYNDDKHRWQVGDMVAELWLTPALALQHGHNINSVTITVMNRDHTKLYNNFAMGFDSIGMNGEGKSVIHTKFADAYAQLEKNKANIEKFLKANIDISALLNLRPFVDEFEKRANGKSLGNDGIQFD
jgi:hypothetical protein